MKKTMITLLMLVVFAQGATAYATTIGTSPLMSETKEIMVTPKEEVEEVTIEGVEEALAERFDYNGRYYPRAYWVGHDYDGAKEIFLGKYETMTSGYYESKPVIYREYLTDMRYDEVLYNALTKDLLAEYPILFEGTIEQKKANELQQILAINEWFVANTMYKRTDHKASLLNQFSLGSNISGEIYGTVAYGELAIDSVLSKEFRTAGCAKGNTLTEETTAAFMVSIKEYNDMLLEGGLISVEYNKTSGAVFYGTCAEYAVLFKAIAQQMGIDVQMVASEIHGWNVIRLADGSIFHLDETQADEGLNSIYYINDSLKGDLGVRSVIYDERTINVGTSPKRLYELMDRRTDGIVVEERHLMDGPKIPVGSFIEVFGTPEVWLVFNDAFKAGYVNK